MYIIFEKVDTNREKNQLGKQYLNLLHTTYKP